MITWRRSSYSGYNGNCAELAITTAADIAKANATAEIHTAAANAERDAQDKVWCDDEAVMNALLRAISDPDSVTPHAPCESVASWQCRAVVEYAAPVIAAAAVAAERERIRHLATDFGATYAHRCPPGQCDDNCGAILAFADLLDTS